MSAAGLRRLAPAAAALLALLLAAPLQASELDDALRAGQVGERFDGYVGAVSSDPSADVRRLVDSINAQRREHYQAIAAKNGVDVAQVAAISGKKLVERAAAGSYVMLPDGAWRRK